MIELFIRCAIKMVLIISRFCSFLVMMFQVQCWKWKFLPSDHLHSNQHRFFLLSGKVRHRRRQNASSRLRSFAVLPKTSILSDTGMPCWIYWHARCPILLYNTIEKNSFLDIVFAFLVNSVEYKWKNWRNLSWQKRYDERNEHQFFLIHARIVPSRGWKICDKSETAKNLVLFPSFSMMRRMEVKRYVNMNAEM